MFKKLVRLAPFLVIAGLFMLVLEGGNVFGGEKDYSWIPLWLGIFTGLILAVIFEKQILKIFGRLFNRKSNNAHIH